MHFKFITIFKNIFLPHLFLLPFFFSHLMERSFTFCFPLICLSSSLILLYILILLSLYLIEFLYYNFYSFIFSRLQFFYILFYPFHIHFPSVSVLFSSFLFLWIDFLWKLIISISSLQTRDLTN